MVCNFTDKASGSIPFLKFKGPFGFFKEIRDILLEIRDIYY